MIKTYRRISADPAEWFEPAEVQKAKDYQRPLNIARAVSLAINAAFLAAIIFTHASPKLADRFSTTSWVVRALVVIIAFNIVGGLLDVPISAWTTFSHEKKWGFSTQTPGGFVADQLKGLVVSCVLFVPLVLGVWWLIRNTELWWLYGWAGFYAFTGLLAFLYPVIIAPIFNRFTPLQDEALATRLRELAHGQGMRIKGIQVMDASKRTRKDNAYFAGFGPSRQIVLFDNTLSQPHDVIASIIGHEIGHWKRKHLITSLLSGAVTTFLLFVVVRFLLTWTTLLHWAGVKTAEDPAAIPILIVGFAVCFPVLGLFSAWLSRAHERQADLFALDVTGDHDAFIETEHGLSTRNLIDLAPSRWRYVRLDHPPPAERLELARMWKAEHEPAPKKARRKAGT